MSQNLTRKILAEHLVEGRLTPGAEIGICIDHTLLQDATGTMAMLEFEALGVDRIRAQLAAQYVDHNLCCKPTSRTRTTADCQRVLPEQASLEL